MHRITGVFFTTDAMRQHAEEHKTLTGQYNKKQNGLVKDIVSIAGGFIDI